MELQVNHTVLRVTPSDFLTQKVDALIHPTNNFLWFSSGFSELLKVKGGEAAEAEAINLGPIQIGHAVATSPRRLGCRLLIHAAAWGQDMMVETHNVRLALTAALDLAAQNKCTSVALPPAGAGIGRFSLLQAVEVTFLTLVDYCMKKASTIHEVYFLSGDRKLENTWEELFQAALSAAPPHND